ncbi:MAG: serine/threonine-protein kinase, partial [Planctomycetota bacterium]
MSDASVDPFDDPVAEQLFAEYLDRLEAGEEVSIDAFCERAPDHADALRKLAQAYARMAPLVDEAFGDTLREAEEFARLPGGVGGRSFAERYAIEGELGRGGMGVVLRALDTELGRPVAIKLVRERPGVDTERRRRRFLNEARVAARLAHPSILTVYEVHADAEGNAAYSMPLVDGVTFEHVIEDLHAGRGDWNRPRALSVLQRVCDAMDYAHSRGVIHRDIKPANLMVGSFGEALVMDWGLARVLDGDDRTLEPLAGDEDSAEPALSREGDTTGTPAYMSLEQAEGRRDSVGPASDVYAMGATLYHLLTGQKPYSGPSGMAVVAAVLSGPPPGLDGLVPGLPPELVAICERAMARPIEDRYPSMSALSDDLRAYLEGRVVQAYASGPWAELRKWIGRNRALSAAMAATVLAVVGGLAGIVWQDALALKEERLSTDLLRLRDLEERRADLWPALPERLGEFDAWLEEAEALRSRLDDHRLRAASLQGRLRQGAIDAVGRLEALAAPGGGLERVEAGRQFATTLAERTLEAHAVDWESAAARVLRDPRFGGLVLKPQLGLVPLGPDRATRLEEFAHLATGTPPRRNREGRLELTEGTGLVLVLVPGGPTRVGARPPLDGEPLDTPHVDPRAHETEWPLHEAVLEPYLISKYELTRDVWERWTGSD